MEDGGAGVLLPTCIHFLTAPLSECVSGTLCHCNAHLCVCGWQKPLKTEVLACGFTSSQLCCHTYICVLVPVCLGHCVAVMLGCVCVSVTEATEDRGAGMLLPTLHSYSHRSTLCTHRRQPAQQRYAGFPSLLRPDLQNILRQCYHNAKVTIDLRWTSNLQNILRLAFVN